MPIKHDLLIRPHANMPVSRTCRWHRTATEPIRLHANMPMEYDPVDDAVLHPNPADKIPCQYAYG